MTADRSTTSGLRSVLPWVGLGAGVFAVVSLLLILTTDDRPNPAAEPARASARVDVGTPSGPKLDVPPTIEPGGGPEPDPTPESAAATGGDLTGEDLQDERKAEGEVPPGGLPKVPTVEIPNAAVDYVEGSRDWIVHAVVGRETIDQIAYRYGVKPKSLRLWNGINASAARAKRGSRLRVKARQIPPERVELQYVVRPGDSWAGIGVRYGVDSNELRALNWTDGPQLRVGQILRMWVDPVLFHWVATEDDDPTKVRPGAVGVGRPQSGTLVNGVQLPKNEFYRLRLPPSSYGTTYAVEAVLRGIVLFEARADYDRSLTFGSMSWRHGGTLTGHVSHQSGRDLDIALPLLEKHPQGVQIKPERVDWEVTWKLVTAMFDTKDVVVVFLDYDLQEPLYKAAARLGATAEERKRYLQYPRGAKAPGLIRHSPGHTSHVHVRFACGPYEIECADNSLGTEAE